MKQVKWYPSWVYVVREDLTRSNMALYDRQQEQIDKKCLELNPAYYSLDIRSRFEIRKEASRQVLNCP